MATIKDVALEAGVSTGTVSRYLNGQALRKENEQCVKNAIRKLGYRENIIAKGLKSNRSRSIGVVVNTLTDVFATSIISHLESFLEEQNYSLLLCDYRNDPNRLAQKLDFLESRLVDGVVVFHVEQDLPALRDMKKRGIAVVAVDAPIRNLKTDTVVVDNYQAVYDAMKRLVELGHKKIGAVAGDPSRYIGSERLRGFSACMHEYGIDTTNLIRYGDYSREAGYQETLRLLESSEQVTAIFAANYYMMLGAFQAIMDKGLEIPRDISLIGFDRFELTDIVRPRLTVIEQPVRAMGKAICKLLVDRIENPESKQYNTIELECELIWHDSVAGPRR